MGCCTTPGLKHFLFAACLIAVGKVVIYNTPDTNTENGGTIREIIIYKQKGKEWRPWHRSREALLDSKSGGMMGDPFQEITINNGILLILQAGGSSWKWDRTDKYRFRHGRFDLIGHTAEFGKLCEEWTSIDYNLSTGNISARKDYEQCGDDGDRPKTVRQEKENFQYKSNTPIHLGNRNQVEVKIVSPKYKFELYL